MMSLCADVPEFLPVPENIVTNISLWVGRQKVRALPCRALCHCVGLLSKRTHAVEPELIGLDAMSGDADVVERLDAQEERYHE